MCTDEVFQNILCLQLVNFTVDSSPVQDRLVVAPGGVHLMLWKADPEAGKSKAHHHDHYQQSPASPLLSPAPPQ